MADPTSIAPVLVTIDDIERAAARVASLVRPTPLLSSANLSELLGRPVWCKWEQVQRTGSFKIRGALNRLATLPEGVTTVVAASAGNHAQGVALAARHLGLRAEVVVPDLAPPPKVAATRGYGAVIHRVSGTVDDCIAAALERAEATGAVYVPPFDDPAIIAGQGTLGLELADEVPPDADVLVPVGGGGLLSGVAVALAARRPDVRVIGVQTAAVPGMVASLAAGEPVAVPAAATLADGIAVARPSALTLAHVRAHVAEVRTVSEEHIGHALVLLVERVKAVVEPAGAVGLAALLADERPDPTRPAVVVLSGGNVDPLLLSRLVEHGLTAAGRFLRVRVVLTDRPGAIAGFTAALAAHDLDVIDIEHHRAGVALPVDRVEVQLTVTARDPEHRDTALGALRAAGFDVTLL